MDVREIAVKTPIRSIVEVGTWKNWVKEAKSPSNNPLTELISGREYWVNSPWPHTFEMIVFREGWWQVKWWEITFVPGQHIKATDWEWASQKMRQTGLWPLLKLWNVQKIEVVPTIDWLGPDDVATIWQAERKIILKDFAWFPSMGLPATILHEACHLWQTDSGFQPNELQAYTLTALFHTLNGDAIDVFGSENPYQAARGLLKKA